MKEREHLVVVGAGIGGVRVAAAVREHGHGGPITLLSAESRLPYERPPLSKTALVGETTPGTDLIAPESFYTDQGVTLRLATPVRGLQPHEGIVELADGERITTDAVVLATGGSPLTLDLPGADLPGVCTLRTADDAAHIRRYLQQGGPVVVVGGGFIGTEIAAAARAWECPVTLIEQAELPMVHALGTEIATRLCEAHHASGINMYTGTGIHGFEGDTHVRSVRLTTGVTVPAALVVIGVGMAPNTSLAQRAGMDVGEGVHVDAAGRSSNPAVWAVGDMTSVRTQGTWTRSQHWQQARSQADRVARALLGLNTGDTPVPWFWSDQGDLNIQLAGHPGPHDTQSWRGDPEEPAFSVLYHRGTVPTGIATVNRGKDVRPAIDMIERSVSLDPNLLADPQVTMKTLAKSCR